MVSNNKVNIQSHLDMANDKLKTFIETKNAEFREKISEDKKKTDLILEGRAQGYVIEMEKKLIERISLLKDEYEKRDLSLKTDYKNSQTDIQTL